MKATEWVKKERERYKKEGTCKCELVALVKDSHELVCMVCGTIYPIDKN
jgi:uncharacterized protein YbaR (Trm112 family)